MPMRNRYVLLFDIVLVILAAAGAFSLRFTWVFLPEHQEFWLFLGMALAVKIPVFLGFGLYQRYWRYAGFWDLMAVVLANSAASILFGLVMVGLVLAGTIEGLSRSIPPIDWLLSLTMTVGIRASLRAIAETMDQHPTNAEAPTTRRVVVIGAGDAGALVAREMQKNPHVGMIPVGFLDDDPTKQGKLIHGVPILGPISSLSAIVQKLPVAEAVIAMPTAGGSTLRAAVEVCENCGLPSQVVPGIYELLGGRLAISRLRKVSITDLLRRPQVAVRSDGASYLRNGTAIITGAGGSVGAELCRQLAYNRCKRLVLVGHGENSIFKITTELNRRFPDVMVRPVVADVRDRRRIIRVFHAIRPDIIFHAAAHKHVPLMEQNAREAITNNVAGTRNVVDAALSAETPRLVLVSTDKAAAPTSVMGVSKRLAEMMVREAARKSGRAYVVVRFGNILGSRGSVVPTFAAQIERGGPVTVTHPDVRRYFMTTPEAVHLILQAGGFGKGAELFVLDMGEPVLLKDLATDMIRLSGLSAAEVPIVYTGLRPGEKLKEELWETEAIIEPTDQPEISIVTETDELPAEQLSDLISLAIDAAENDNLPQMFSVLNQCVPTAQLSCENSAKLSESLSKITPAPET